VNKPSLCPGIYLLIVNPDLGLVIHWPENGCYEENASPQKKKNMINFHRYVIYKLSYYIQKSCKLIQSNIIDI
jgi:hypothetical protein